MSPAEQIIEAMHAGDGVEYPNKAEGRLTHTLPLSPAPNLTLMDLMSIALSNKSGIDVIERLSALREKELMRDAEIHFNNALSRAQGEIRRIAPDLENSGKKYASYAKLDSRIRPVYLKEGFSISFNHADTPKPDHVRILAYVSLGAHTRTYQMDMPCDGKGAKGGDVMTKTHATASADSYGKRYLLKDIFNVAIGEEDDDGNGGSSYAELPEQLEWIANAGDLDELKRLYQQAYMAAQHVKDTAAMNAIRNAKDRRKKELQ